MKNIIIVLFLLPISIFAQIDLTQMDDYLSDSRVDWEIPGMAIAIVKDGKVLLSKGYGVKEAGKDDLVDEHTLFAIASNTKAFVSAAISVLVAEGQLSWDDRVKEIIPDFELYDAYVSDQTTIRDLLCHRVGLGTFSGDMMWYKSNLNVNQLIASLKHVPPAYSFRSGYGYSNLMFITAGEVIKRVSGLEWQEFVANEFFSPLDMKRTITSTNQLSGKGNFATPHKPFEAGNQPIDWVNWDNMGAAGGIISSANDMSKWMIMQLNKGIWDNDTILDRKQQVQMWTPHNNHTVSDQSIERIPGRHFDAYGLGWSLGDYYGNMTVSHSGGYDGMYSKVFLVPDQNLGIAILTNSMKGNTTPLCYYIVNQFIEKDHRDWSKEWLERSRKGSSMPGKVARIKEARIKKSKPTLSIDSYKGIYWSGMHGNVTIIQEDNTLKLSFENAPALSATLRHWHYDTWEILWDESHAWFDFGTVQFVLDNQLEIAEMRIDVPNYDIFFDEVNLKKIK